MNRQSANETDLSAASWPQAPAQLADLIQVQAGSVVSRVLLKRPVGNVTLFAFDAGQELSEHTAPFDAMVQVVEGRAEISVAGKVHPVIAGQVILLPAGQPHAVKAPEALKMLLTMIRQ